MLQGFSVLAMLCGHIFSKNYEGLFQPLIFIDGVPLSYCFSQLFDFAAFGFAFCSGYAHINLFDKPDYIKKRLKSLLLLMINFWLVLVVSSIISIIIGTADFMPQSVSAFLGTAFLYDMHFNGAWWYLWAYVLLVLFSPLILRAVKKLPLIPVLAISFLVYCAAFYVRFQTSTDNWLLLKFGPFGMTLFEYVLGCLAAKYMFFTKTGRVVKKIPLALRVCLSCGLFVFLLFARTFLIPSTFFTPFSGAIIFLIFIFWKKSKWVETVFLFFGKHSTNIWLTHMFFITSLWVYIAKYPVLIFVFMLLITIPISFVISYVMKGVSKLMNKPVKTV